MFVAEYTDGKLFYGVSISAERDYPKDKQVKTNGNLVYKEGINGKEHVLSFANGVGDSAYEVLDNGNLRSFSYHVLRDANGNVVYDEYGNAVATFEFGQEQSSIGVKLIEYNGHLVAFDPVSGYFGDPNAKLVQREDGSYQIEYTDEKGNKYYKDANVVDGEITFNSESGELDVKIRNEEALVAQSIDAQLENVRLSGMCQDDEKGFYYEGFRLSNYDTYEQYIDAMYNGGAYYQYIATDGLHIFQSSTAFYEAKERGQVWGFEADENWKAWALNEFTISASDIWHVTTMVDAKGNNVPVLYTIDNVNAYTVTAPIEFNGQIAMNVGSEPFKVPKSDNEEEGGGGNSTPDVTGTTSRVSMEMSQNKNGDYIMTLGSTEDMPAQAEVSFNIKDPVTGELATSGFTPQFSQFLAGTEIVLPQMTMTSTNENAVAIKNAGTDSGTITRQDISVEVGENGATVHLAQNTKLYQLPGAIAENGVVNGQVIVTNTLYFVPKGQQEVSQVLTTTATINAGQNWETANKSFSLDGGATYLSGKVDVFGGTLDTSKQTLSYGFWGGKIKLGESVSDLSLHTNIFARTLERVGGLLLSVVAFVVDPFVQAANAISTLFTDFPDNFTFENLSKAFGETFGALTGTNMIYGIIKDGWNDHFYNNQLMRLSTSLMTNKAYDDVKAKDVGRVAVGSLVAVVAIAFTVVTGGLGAAAFVPALGGAASASAGLTAVASGALLAAATSSAWSTVSLVISALVTAYFASTAAMNAYDAFSNGDTFGGVMNLLAMAVAIAFPVRIGSAAKNASIALKRYNLRIRQQKQQRQQRQSRRQMRQRKQVKWQKRLFL